jgi:hypothetical protein
MALTAAQMPAIRWCACLTVSSRGRDTEDNPQLAWKVCHIDSQRAAASHNALLDFHSSQQNGNADCYNSRGMQS